MTTREKFRATLLTGHKGAAFELAFDPATRWSVRAGPIAPGRRGHPVRGVLNGVAFESFVLPRSRRHWVLVDAALCERAAVAPGDTVSGTIEPREDTAPTPVLAPAAAARLIARARKLCLAHEGAYEQVAHGEPTFRVGKRVFAMVANNHHSDGRIALWINAAMGVQADKVEQDPDSYFVPPYVGTRGWVGVRLDRALEWTEIAAALSHAYTVTRDAQPKPRAATKSAAAATTPRPPRRRA